MRRDLLLTCSLILSMLPLRALADDRPPDVTDPPAYERFLVIPLRVHILRSSELDEVNCNLDDADIDRILGKVNGVWHRAGIHFGLESLVREPAQQQERFRLVRDLNGSAPVGLFRVLLPETSRKFAGLHVYFVHQFPVNGVYMGEDFAIVKETARLRNVEGGIDEPIPRVTAHELGHALGLPHRQDRTNLLASGTTGTALNQAEVERARDRASRIAGAVTVAELRQAAERARDRHDREQARRLWGWLADIPGSEAKAARTELDRLGLP